MFQSPPTVQLNLITVNGISMNLQRQILLVASFAAGLLASVATTGSISALATSSISAGSGQGSIIFHAHRVASSDWAPCFALTCDAGTGPGASMYFLVYDSSGTIVAKGFADESGTTVTGLNVGSTYNVYPADCDLCHNSTHNVVFDHWGDGSTARPLPVSIQSASSISIDAYYKIVELGSAASTTSTSPSTSTTTTSTTPTTSPSTIPTSPITTPTQPLPTTTPAQPAVTTPPSISSTQTQPIGTPQAPIQSVVITEVSGVVELTITTGGTHTTVQHMVVGPAQHIGKETHSAHHGLKLGQINKMLKEGIFSPFLGSNVGVNESGDN